LGCNSDDFSMTFPMEVYEWAADPRRGL
jgi:hypothetical protein